MPKPKPKPKPDTKRLLTSRETAKRLNCSERTLERTRTTGIGGPPFQRIGARGVRYSVDAVEQWLADNVKHSTSEPAAPTRRKARATSGTSQPQVAL